MTITFNKPFLLHHFFTMPNKHLRSTWREAGGLKGEKKKASMSLKSVIKSVSFEAPVHRAHTPSTLTHVQPGTGARNTFHFTASQTLQNHYCIYFLLESLIIYHLFFKKKSSTGAASLHSEQVLGIHTVVCFPLSLSSVLSFSPTGLL